MSPARGDRSGKASNHKPDVYALEESHDAIVPMKLPNNGAQASTEVVEGRVSIKENSVESSTRPTQSGERVSQGLGGVRRVARERRAGADLRFLRSAISRRDAGEYRAGCLKHSDECQGGRADSRIEIQERGHDYANQPP